jgi:hypothetical protein
MLLPRWFATLFIVSALCFAQDPPPPPAGAPEKTISAQEAQELFRTVDELLQFASKSTGLPVKTPVRRQLTSRDQLEAFLVKNMQDDEQQKRFERSELVIKKFGLLPRDFQLRPFLIKLLKEQVAGYYDSKRKTVHLMDWISAEAQRPVLAHELMHALQDQEIDLEKWMREPLDAAKKQKQASALAEADEAIAARHAVTEGQAMAVLLDYILSAQGRSLADSPEIVEAMQSNMDSMGAIGSAGSAPLLIREAIVWSYRDGLKFTHELMKAGGKQRAFRDTLLSPPTNTRQVLSPASYLTNEIIAPLALPDLRTVLGKQYESYDVGSIGQFDIVVFAKEFADKATAARLAPSWRGGIYLAVNHKGVQPARTGDLGVIFLSKWSNAEQARAFADFYSSATPKRFTNVAAATTKWKTEEGEVIIDVIGEHVLVIESLEPAVSAKVKAAIVESIRFGRPMKSAEYAPSLGIRLWSPISAIQQLWLQAVVPELAKRTAVQNRSDCRVD